MLKKPRIKKTQTERMLSIRSQLLNYLFIAAILVFTFVFLFRRLYDPENPISLSDFLSLDWWWLLPALGCLVISVGSEAVNLFLLCRAVGYKRSLKQAVVYASSDIYFSAITPSATGGQPAAAYYMTKGGVPLSQSTAVLILNVTLYTVGLLVISLVALLVKPQLFLDFSALEKACVIVGISFHAILIVFCLACMLSKKFVYFLGDLMFGILGKLHLVKNREERITVYRASVDSYRSAFAIVKEHKWLLPTLMTNAVMQRMILAPVAYFVFRAMGLGDAATFWELFAMQLYCIVGASALPLPGGMGLAETLHVETFSKYLPDMGACMFSMLLTRIFTSYLAIVTCGAITLTHHFRMKRRESQRRLGAETAEDIHGCDPDTQCQIQEET